jgi:N-acetyl-gamma-glutamyl-phosphate reductase
MIDVGIIGASGYTGGELLRIFTRHPEFRVTWATSRQYAGQSAGEVFPYLRDFTDLTLTAPALEHAPAGLKAVMVALPHTEAMGAVPSLLEMKLRVVDLSADFRIDDPSLYTEWYGADHAAPALLGEAVYGLPERYRADIAAASLVANPGCYPTAALLALTPLVKRGLIAEGEIVVDAKSSVSGAGRAPKQGSLLCEAHEGLRAYSVGSHRHIPEIEQELAKAAGHPVSLTFAPHLVPLNRGLLETIYVRLKGGGGAKEVEAAYHEDYGDEPFVKVAPAGVLPGIQDVAGTNHCRLGFTEDRRGGRIVLVSVIDNLVKGASGQAVQNLNLMFGLPEGLGLDGPGLFP